LRIVKETRQSEKWKEMERIESLNTMKKKEAKQFGFDHHVIDSFPKEKDPPW
jgi:hypothetical protein